MTIRDPKSIVVVFVYALVNSFIIMMSLRAPEGDTQRDSSAKTLAPDYTEIEKLDYFHLKKGSPVMSLSADKMRSQAEEIAEFEFPKGVYNYQQKNKTIKYSAEEGIYLKKKEVLTLIGDVKVSSDEAQYFADRIEYFFSKDQILGIGNVKFEGEDLKSRDYVTVTSESMLGHPEKQITTFKGNVKGNMQRKKKYEGKMTFSSNELQLDGNKSLAHLEGDARMKRDNYDITA